MSASDVRACSTSLKSSPFGGPLFILGQQLPHRSLHVSNNGMPKFITCTLGFGLLGLYCESLHRLSIASLQKLEACSLHRLTLKSAT